MGAELPALSTLTQTAWLWFRSRPAWAAVKVRDAQMTYGIDIRGG